MPPVIPKDRPVLWAANYLAPITWHILEYVSGMPKYFSNGMALCGVSLMQPGMQCDTPPVPACERCCALLAAEVLA